MKRNVCFIIIALMLCQLCACGKTTEPQQGTDAPPMLTAAPAANAGQSAAPAEAEAEQESPLKAQAESFIGKDIAQLIEALGQPLSSSYAPSCLGSGEDGEYIYDGVKVYTYKEGETETVRSVE